MPDYPWQLAVREFEDTSDDEICIILDTAVPHPNTDDWALIAYRLEKSISFAIGYARQLCELKHQVRFLYCQDGDPPAELRLSHPARDIPILERRLARLKPTRESEPTRRLVEWQSQRSDAILMVISLQNSTEMRLSSGSGLTILNPEWQQSLVVEVGT
jgi:uncharacterized protein (DUF58 family)